MGFAAAPFWRLVRCFYVEPSVNSLRTWLHLTALPVTCKQCELCSCHETKVKSKKKKWCLSVKKTQRESRRDSVQQNHGRHRQISQIRRLAEFFLLGCFTVVILVSALFTARLKGILIGRHRPIGDAARSQTLASRQTGSHKGQIAMHLGKTCPLFPRRRRASCEGKKSRTAGKAATLLN